MLASWETPTPIDPGEMDVELDGDLSVASGYDTMHAVLLHNLRAEPLGLTTNGHLTAYVVDALTGRRVGGYHDAQHRPGVGFTLSPGGVRRVPLPVGTASLAGDLCYAIPPGRWGVRAPLRLTDGRNLLIPALPMTVTGPPLP
jgi:hypothetical protein